MTQIDKSVQQFTLINFMGAIIANAHAFAAATNTVDVNGAPVPVEVAIQQMASTMAVVALREAQTNDVFQFPDGSGVGDALKLVLSVQENPYNTEFEDGLQEGELALNAAALITHNAGMWFGGSPNGDEVDFPGSGAEEGEARINDLIRAAALIMGEIGRLERKEQAALEYAEGAEERAEAVTPPGLH